MPEKLCEEAEGAEGCLLTKAIALLWSCTCGCNMAVWQLKSAKQSQPGKTSRDGQNCSSEHTSL